MGDVYLGNGPVQGKLLNSVLQWLADICFKKVVIPGSLTIFIIGIHIRFSIRVFFFLTFLLNNSPNFGKYTFKIFTKYLSLIFFFHDHAFFQISNLTLNSKDGMLFSFWKFCSFSLPISVCGCDPVWVKCMCFLRMGLGLGHTFSLGYTLALALPSLFLLCAFVFLFLNSLYPCV